MSLIRIESWSAFAPGIETRADWERWLQDPYPLDEQPGKIALPGIPALLRRRFSAHGKCALAAALPLLEHIDAIPVIYASRHGDTPLPLSLLQGIARGEPMSPTRFSLAVHNAVGGLLSIVRKDRSPVTAIAAMQGMVLQALFEAVGQLQTEDRVLCVVYEVPLPGFFQQHRDEPNEPFAHAIAMLLGNHAGDAYLLEAENTAPRPEPGLLGPFAQESLGLLRMLAGQAAQADLGQGRCRWRLRPVAD